ncbi:MAG: DUF6152 family protein [Steroidobacteraceae bacterium]
MSKHWVRSFSAGMIVALAPAAFAHHSQAMFDRTKVVEAEGTLEKLQMVLPHSWISVKVSGSEGEVVWRAEGNGPPRGESTLSHFAVGDKVKLMVHPFRDGRPGGMFIKMVTADGQYEYAEAQQNRQPAAAPAAAP